MGTPALSCSTDALSNALIVDSDDEVDQSSMWVQQEDPTSSDLPPDFLEPLSPSTEVISPLPPFPNHPARGEQHQSTHGNRQFWKSGDFAGSYEGASFATEGMDHARVHPKFLHSNATSHKWVLGAIAELLDNAVDEIRNGATFVKIDVETNPRNGEPMLVIEDDGGGMDPDCMRRCMSLGYSAKSKLSNTIGQYGNGFKTSTMRLGADVIVFSRHQGSKPSESIGMMSYTFLTSTGQNDIVVPIVDFQIEAFGIRKLIRSNVDDWMESMEAIENWSPYSSQAELVSQFRSMPRRQGTKVIIYNLWEDEEGLLELDFTADPHDIQIRATSRDEKTLKLAARYPSCKHYLTHRHSLRIYVSILYLRLPAKFKVFLRGIQIPNYSLRNEMMLVEQVTYRPKDAGHSKAVVTLGFVKDAKEHIDVSGFNVYHKNRLIKPFWRIWNPSDTRGRGIIAILEANFVEPAHDKQGFERTIVLTRLEARLIEMQKSYWNKHCHMIGYTNASMRKSVQSLRKDINSPAKGGVDDSPANGVTRALTRAGAQPSVVERPVASVHVNGVANGCSHVQGVSPAVVKQTMQSNPSRLEVQEPNLMIGSIDSVVSGAGNGNGVDLRRQDLVQVHSGHLQTLQCVQVAPLRDVTGSGVRNTALSPARLPKEELFSPCSTGIAPVIIDLDSPEVDEKCEDAAFDMPLSQSCDLQKKMVAEEIRFELGFMSGDGNACENSLRGDVAAGSPKGNEAEGVINASISFQPLGEVKSLPEKVGFDSFHDEVVRGIKQVETRPKEQGMESYVQSDGLVATAPEECSAAPIAFVKNVETRPKEQGMESYVRSDGLAATAPEESSAAPIAFVKNVETRPKEQCMESYVRSDSLVATAPEECSAAPIAFVENVETGPKGQGMETYVRSDGLVVATALEECLAAPIAFVENVETRPKEQGMESYVRSDGLVATTPEECSAASIAFVENREQVELEPFGKEVLETGARSEATTIELDDFFDSLAAPQSNVPSHSSPSFNDTEALATEIDLKLPDIAENATSENDHVPLLSLTEALGQHESNSSNARSKESHNEHENRNLVTCQVHCEDVPKDCDKLRVLPETEVKVLSDMDAVMTDADGQEGDDCLEPKQDIVNDPENFVVSIMEEHTHGNMAVVPHDGTSFYDKKDSLGSIHASCQDIISVPTMAIVDVAMGGIASNSSIDLLEEDRLVVAKEQIEYLQQSIEAVVVEVDDLKDQLQQHRELQHLELRNLNMELAKALSRLEELRG